MKRATTLRQTLDGLGLQGLVDELRAIERDVAGVDRQYDAIPSSCPRGQGPERWLDDVLAKLACRFEKIVGAPVAGEHVATDDPRDLLRLLDGLARRCGASLDTSPLPMRPGYRTWAGDESLYESSSVPRIVGGQHTIARLRFVPGPKKITLRDDGALI